MLQRETVCKFCMKLILAACFVALVIELYVTPDVENRVYDITGGRLGTAMKVEDSVKFPLVENGKYELSFSNDEIEIKPIVE